MHQLLELPTHKKKTTITYTPRTVCLLFLKRLKERSDRLNAISKRVPFLKSSGNVSMTTELINQSYQDSQVRISYTHKHENELHKIVKRKEKTTNPKILICSPTISLIISTCLLVSIDTYKYITMAYSQTAKAVVAFSRTLITIASALATLCLHPFLKLEVSFSKKEPERTT